MAYIVMAYMVMYGRYSYWLYSYGRWIAGPCPATCRQPALAKSGDGRPSGAEHTRPV